jgi:polysaccharide export outer membrane protein
LKQHRIWGKLIAVNNKAVSGTKAGRLIVKSILVGCIVLLLLPIPLNAQTKDKPAVSSQPTQSLPAPASEVSDDYIIGLEDVLAISVWKEPELSIRDIVVRPDGKVSLPLVNDIQAKGLTPKQLQERITEKLKDFVDAPNVNVTVLKVNSQLVSVVGEVKKPGVYPIGSPMTVLDMLARVGGVTENAKTKNITILRNENAKKIQFPFNYKNVIRGRDLHQNILLKNGDTILVP